MRREAQHGTAAESRLTLLLLARVSFNGNG